MLFFQNPAEGIGNFLFGQPNRSFFATELIALMGSGSGAVQRELERLSESGLLS